MFRSFVQFIVELFAAVYRFEWLVKKKKRVKNKKKEKEGKHDDTWKRNESRGRVGIGQANICRERCRDKVNSVLAPLRG